MRKFSGILAFLAFSVVDCVSQATTPLHSSLQMETIKTGVEKQPELTMVLRLPTGVNPKGLLAFCTWQNETQSLQKAVLNDANPPVAWALNKGFAVLTWNTAHVWVGGKSHGELDRRADQLLDAEFDQVSRAWDYGLLRFARKNGLPTEGIFLYGISGGAHWAHRLAMRKPSRFLAVHIHVANSFDKPFNQASRILWLVSSGDLDFGKDASRQFYDNCRQANYPIVLKLKRGLGHQGDPEIDQLRNTFFDYALALSYQEIKGGRPPFEIMRESIASPSYIGDLINESVVPTSRISEIPLNQHIPLPNRDIAQDWGRILE